jgi:ribosomal protein L11 methyltransferase
VLAVAAARLGWAPVHACDFDPAAVAATRAAAAANGVSLAVVERCDLRTGEPPWAPTVVANLVRPLLLEVAARMARDDRGVGDDAAEDRDAETAWSEAVEPVARAAAPLRAPERVVASGLELAEVDEVVAAFARCGLALADRRDGGGWSAILLANAGRMPAWSTRP